MTNEEARQWFLKVYSEIKGKGYADENEEAYEMAIKALEQESCEIIHGSTYGGVSWGGTYRPQEPCNDAISRQAVLATLDDMDNVLDEDRTVKNYKELLKECYEVLPSVRPQEKTGHWIENKQKFK